MAAPGENLRINADRLWDSIMEMAKIGPGMAGGNNRQTLTDDDGEGRHLFKRWCEAAGLNMGVDQMGTMFARREGTDPDALPVYVGSHLDTQPTGGKYDGVLGVLGGLEVIRTLNDLGIKTKHPIVVTNWTNEEGTRFAPAMLASGVFAGIHELDWAYDRTDAKGKRFGDELGAHRLEGRGKGRRAQDAGVLRASHRAGARSWRTRAWTSASSPMARACWWLQVTLTGKEAHTGSTPMPMRRNAGLGMARIIELVHEVAMDYQPDAVGAVGHMEVYPNSRNVIAGQGRLHRRHPLARHRRRWMRWTRRIARRHRADLRGARHRLRDRAGRPFRSRHLRRRLRQGDPRRCREARLLAPQHRLGRRPRRLLDQPRGADRHGHVPLRRRPQPQRGRGNLQGMGSGRLPTCCSTRWWRRRRSWSERTESRIMERLANGCRDGPAEGTDGSGTSIAFGREASTCRGVVA